MENYSYEYCLSLNPRTHWISDHGELEAQWFRDAVSVGVTGATSTSLNQLEEVGIRVKELSAS